MRIDTRTGLIACCLLPAMLVGCGGAPFHVKNLVKSDVDMVIDHHVAVYKDLCSTLTRKLYKRNPRELAKASGHTVDSRLVGLFADQSDMLPELNEKRGTDAMELAFDPAFHGDRVYALMYGLIGMLKASYNFEDEHFITSDSLDGQKIYNSARNLEIVAWRLIHRKLPNGEPFLLTYGVHNGVPNLSYERIFSKLIAHQDMMATIVADKTNRRINFVVQGMASAVLFPLGI
jgi:hypothetical protein